MALPCAFLLKRFQGAPDQDAPRQKDLAFSGTVYEIALVVMSAYMAYLTAEVSLRRGNQRLFLHVRNLLAVWCARSCSECQHSSTNSELDNILQILLSSCRTFLQFPEMLRSSSAGCRYCS